jgi:hypothetical protein
VNYQDLDELDSGRFLRKRRLPEDWTEVFGTTLTVSIVDMALCSSAATAACSSVTNLVISGLLRHGQLSTGSAALRPVIHRCRCTGRWDLV